MKEIVLKGIPAAPGIASGSAFILDKQEFIITPRVIMEKEVPIEIARFEEALVRTQEEILEIQKNLEVTIGKQHAKIFDAHLLVLKDKDLIDQVIRGIQTEKLSAEYIFSEVLKKYARMFSKIEDEYLRERMGDVSDVGRRILKNLVDENKLHELANLNEELILISHDISPSDTASMYKKNIIAFATDIGGKTSHTAIMAKSLGVPAVVSLKDATLRIQNQNNIIVDGGKGLVIIHPTEETKKYYRIAQSQILKIQDRFQEIKNLSAETLDKHKVNLLANLELSDDIQTARKYGAQGIGLYRTEYFYMNRIDLPSEEEQYKAYTKVVKTMAPHPVTIRTLDLGGDKFISSLQIPREMYPSLGWRAIRFCLARPDIFKIQLRAILRASVHGHARMMYPMISSAGELRQANAILKEVQQSLKEEKIPFNEKMPVGIMIEVPSAVMIADILAKETDFFSIGTNDLVQYALAVDRVSEQTANLYEPSHPGVLRLIRNTIDAAHKENIKVGLCGEMASEPGLALILLGLGLDDFSMSPLSLLQIKQLIRSVKFRDAKRMADQALELSMGEEVDELCQSRLKEWVPDFGKLNKKG